MRSEGRAALAIALAKRAALEVGLDAEGARLRRQLLSSQVELPAAGVMARVESLENQVVAERCVAAGRFLERRDVPAVRLVKPDRQPLVYPEGAVTLWELVEIVEGPLSAEDLGSFGRELHEATVGDLPADMESLEVFDPIRRGLEDSDTRNLPDTRLLRAECSRLESSWRETIASDPLGIGFVHGDFHRDNVVVSSRGPLLLDLEDSCRGPRSWDLVPEMTGVRRYGAPATRWRDFRRGYGADPSAWPGFEFLCRVFELSMTVWAVAHRHASATMAREADLRLMSFLGRGEQTWTLV